MNDDQITEITITAIENNLISGHATNEETAKEIAKFINMLRKETEIEYEL